MLFTIDQICDLTGYSTLEIEGAIKSIYTTSPNEFTIEEIEQIKGRIESQTYK